MSLQTILIIEDQENIRSIMFEVLLAENYHVIEAENGTTALKLIQSVTPDLIICDIAMPEMNGYEVLNQIRDNSITAAIPFIFLSARVTQTDIRQGMELGADDYLIKPFTRAELLGAISARLEKKKTFDRQAQEKIKDLCLNISHSLPHELHTPLNGIIGLSRLLIDDFNSIEQDEHLEMLEEIYISGQRLYHLTQNFLLYTQIEVLAASPERIQNLENSNSKSRTKDIINDLIIDVQDIEVRIQMSKLQKIIEEIVDNAFKFSQSGTNVYVTSEIQDNTFTLTVVDKGRGMTPEQTKNLGAYMQFERKLHEQQGSGLGLIIAKRLTEIHGGELNIESIPEKETKIHIRLPIIK
jgi:two-component system, sensor histidine kinase and response regulator